MSFPKISIVTPSFNQAAFLERTILSVLNQNYPNLEYIIIDGGSDDGSIEILKKYEKYLSYWESEKDEGQYHAIQKGFEKSTGEIMAWINSDDVYLGRSLFSIAEIFKTFPQVQWLTGNRSFMDEEDRIVLSRNARQWSKFNIYNREYVWIQQESTFWKRSLWEKAGSRMDLSYCLAGDFALWIRFFRFEQLYTTEALLGCFRIRKQNQKTLEQMPSYMKEYRAIMQAEEIPKNEKNQCRRIKLLECFVMNVPLVRRMNFIKKKYDQAYGYSPIIIYDRKTCRFILRK